MAAPLCRACGKPIAKETKPIFFAMGMPVTLTLSDEDAGLVAEAALARAKMFEASALTNERQPPAYQQPALAAAWVRNAALLRGVAARIDE